MNRPRLIQAACTALASAILLSAAPLASAASASPAGALPAQSKPPEVTRIAVVDIQKLADGLLETAATNEKLKKIKDDVEKVKKDYSDQLAAIDKDLQLEGD